MVEVEIHFTLYGIHSEEQALTRILNSDDVRRYLAETARNFLAETGGLSPDGYMFLDLRSIEYLEPVTTDYNPKLTSGLFRAKIFNVLPPDSTVVLYSDKKDGKFPYDPNRTRFLML